MGLLLSVSMGVRITLELQSTTAFLTCFKVRGWGTAGPGNPLCEPISRSLLGYFSSFVSTIPASLWVQDHCPGDQSDTGTPARRLRVCQGRRQACAQHSQEQAKGDMSKGVLASQDKHTEYPVQTASPNEGVPGSLSSSVSGSGWKTPEVPGSHSLS